MKTVSATELIEAGIGFSITDSDLPESAFSIEVRKDFETSSGPGMETSRAYWTTSGEHPVTHDQGVQYDLVRSAGGWSDISPEGEEDYRLRNGLELPVKFSPEWGEYHLYLRREKEARQDRCVAIFDWLKKQTDPNELKSHWGRFRTRVRASRSECSRLNDWSKCFLTKEQVSALEAYYLIRLRNLSK